MDGIFSLNFYELLRRKYPNLIWSHHLQTNSKAEFVSWLAKDDAMMLLVTVFGASSTSPLILLVENLFSRINSFWMNWYLLKRPWFMKVWHFRNWLSEPLIPKLIGSYWWSIFQLRSKKFDRLMFPHSLELSLDSRHLRSLWGHIFCATRNVNLLPEKCFFLNASSSLSFSFGPFDFPVLSVLRKRCQPTGAPYWGIDKLSYIYS